MLEQLYIENVAVIERASMELTSGFNVLTGETGAGKSIIIDSLSAVLGERTSRDLIRTGAPKAVVSAVFSGIGGAAAEKIAELGFAPEEDGTLILSRSMTAEGKNNCKIGGRPAIVSLLREVGRLLVNIHGQHDSQALLDPDIHYTFLDALADNAAQRADYAAVLEQYKRTARALRALNADEQDKQKRTELLTYKINELETADIQLGELDELTEACRRMQNGRQIMQALSCAVGLLYGDEDNPGGVSAVLSAGKYTQEAAQDFDSLRPLAERLTELGYEVEAASQELRRTLETQDFSPVALAQAEERLELLRTLTHKYGGDEAELLKQLDAAKEELDTITHSGEEQKRLEEELEILKYRLIETAARVTDTRKAAGAHFSAAVEAELAFLNMKGVGFVADIQPTSYTKTGADKVEFLISTNPGEPPKPLARIASGGELSRIMLAIKNVLAELDEIPTLIFDEIDTGISGRAARAVGIKLKAVSKGRQVICITHLAQIAAMADNHLFIEKNAQDGRTFTEVKRLLGNDRVDEIARIMSGGQLTDSLEQSARELLKMGSEV